MFKRIFPVFLVVVLILAACGAPKNDVANEEIDGFAKIKSYMQGPLETTMYTGASTIEEAIETFHGRAIDEGWEKTDRNFDYFTGYSGDMFKKDDEFMMINMAVSGTQVTVLVMTTSAE
jgi:hypothetical protein